MAVLQNLLALAATGLFLWAAWVCVRGVWLVQPAYSLPAPQKSELFAAAAACLAVGAMVQLIVVAFALKETPGMTLNEALGNFFYYNIDERHYINLARYGYSATDAAYPDQHLMIVFFPLYPLLLRLLNPFGNLPWHLLAFWLQLGLTCWWSMGLYTLCCRNYGKQAAGWTLAFLLASPASFFYFLPMTESLFLALCVSFFLALEAGKPCRATVFGLLAALCRSPGALLMGVAVLWYAGQWRLKKERPTWQAIFPIASPVAGLLLYFALNWRVYGNWQQYAIYQKEHWYQQMGFFWSTVKYHLHYFKTWLEEGNWQGALFLSLAAVLTILLGLALLAAAASRLKSHHLSFGLASIAFTMGTTWLISAPRYGVGLFCLPAALALLVRPRWAKLLTLAGLMAASAAYFAMFLKHGPIY